MILLLLHSKQYTEVSFSFSFLCCSHLHCLYIRSRHSSAAANSPVVIVVVVVVVVVVAVVVFSTFFLCACCPKVGGCVFLL